LEVYDRIIRNEKQHALKIQELEQNDADKTEEINFLRQQIKEIQVSNPPETCAHLGKQGVTRTQDIFIDSDGVNQGTVFSHIVSAETVLFLIWKSKVHST
jgi:hypothetical protein